MGGYRGEKEEEALCVKGMRLGGRGLFTAGTATVLLVRYNVTQ
jgi:hypothetical protein